MRPSEWPVARRQHLADTSSHQYMFYVPFGRASALTAPARLSQSVFFCHAPACSKPHASASDNTAIALRFCAEKCAETVRKLLRYSPARLDPFHWRKAFSKRCETVRKLRGNVRSIMGVIWGFFSVLRVRVLLGLSSPKRKKPAHGGVSSGNLLETFGNLQPGFCWLLLGYFWPLFIVDFLVTLVDFTFHRPAPDMPLSL